MSQGQPSFPPRHVYASSSKLPDRPPFAPVSQQLGQSTFSRRPDQSLQFTQAPLPAPHGVLGGRQDMQKESNALSELSEEQRDEINEAFSLFDLDRDRHLDYHELRVALRALGFQLTKPEINQILQANGVPKQNLQRQAPTGRGPPREPASQHPSQMLISLNAFQRVAAQKVVERDPRDEVQRAFDLFDQDRKGFIGLDDLRRVARELGETGLEEEEMRAMIEEFDYDGQGGVSREAFFAICLQ